MLKLGSSVIPLAALRQVALDSEHVILGLAVHGYEVLYLVGRQLLFAAITCL